MPRHSIRNYRALAERQNRTAWGDAPLPSSALVDRCIPEFEESAHRNQARHLQARRDRLVERINEAVELPSAFSRCVYFRALPTAVLETDEAVDKLARAIAQKRRKFGARHWSAGSSPSLVDLREAMVFARWFRRFGARAWAAQRQAEAA